MHCASAICSRCSVQVVNTLYMYYSQILCTATNYTPPSMKLLTFPRELYRTIQVRLFSTVWIKVRYNSHDHHGIGHFLITVQLVLQCYTGKEQIFTLLFFLQFSLPKLASKCFICNLLLGLGLKFVRLKLWGLTPFDVVMGQQNIKKNCEFYVRLEIERVSCS